MINNETPVDYRIQKKVIESLISVTAVLDKRGHVYLLCFQGAFK